MPAIVFHLARGTRLIVYMHVFVISKGGYFIYMTAIVFHFARGTRLNIVTIWRLAWDIR